MVTLKLSQLPAFVPAHLGESSTSGLAGIIAPVQARVGLLSETVPPAGVALLDVDTNESAMIAMAAQHTVSTVNLKLVVILDDCDFASFINMDLFLFGDTPPTGPCRTTEPAYRLGESERPLTLYAVYLRNT
jgi:hypothetical protein